ncbi:mitochondrial ribosomal protein L28-domain-containing protein [Jimgerdemannia flammicorona]|uniref:Large ribosomal subunit protein mL40 n=1 Tax=Jimgerdemannia flammicorona TaxID=994334 RepID=A0A433QT59_9FUNG|nr:mitochondrial ribosomal protein L28-domain-containing protein [Jimgerdemannia flammicorona]
MPRLQNSVIIRVSYIDSSLYTSNCGAGPSFTPRAWNTDDVRVDKILGNSDATEGKQNRTMASPFLRRAALSTLSTTRVFLLRAAAQPSSSSSSSPDVRTDLIKKVLFELPPREPLELSEEDQERHETIERAWKLVKMLEREARDADLERKFRKMREAMVELERTNPKLFRGAMLGNRHVTFPRQMKIPTETPATEGWNYSYKPPIAIEAAGVKAKKMRESS